MTSVDSSTFKSESLSFAEDYAAKQSEENVAGATFKKSSSLSKLIAQFAGQPGLIGNHSSLRPLWKCRL